MSLLNPSPAQESLRECLDDTVGSQVGTETTTGQVVDTGRTVHVSGTTTLTYTVTFSDGRYVTGSAVEHFSFNANGPLTVSTSAIIEPRTIFSAEGEPSGRSRSTLCHTLRSRTRTETAARIREKYERRLTDSSSHVAVRSWPNFCSPMAARPVVACSRMRLT